MPKKGSHLFALVVVGGIAALSAGIAQNVSKQEDGIGGFVATTLGGAVGAGLGLLVLGGSGARLA